MWDPRQRDTPVACMEPAEGETRRDCWCVAFGNSYSDTERAVCAGYDNGDIKMFDLRTMTQRWETNIKNGVSQNYALVLLCAHVFRRIHGYHRLQKIYFSCNKSFPLLNVV